MLTPGDKVLNGGNDIVQILVTRVCDRHCSNCTQILEFRSDTKHISPDVFRLAVRSLKDWPGIIAMFGGNPCAHPQFDDLCAILAHEVPDQRKRGLWTNNLFTDHKGEVARATFYPAGRFNLNAHGDAEAAELFDKWLPGKMIPTTRARSSWHSPILMNYRDFGMSDEDWIQARESCDINQKWSGIIAERDGKPYAWFCEVAAALDAVTGQNHGIEAVPGWWRLPMSYFHEQVAKCCDSGCGVPLRRKGSLDKDETYDVSASWALQLPNQHKVGVHLHLDLPEGTQEATDYMAMRSSK